MNNTENFKALIAAKGNEALKAKAEAAAATVIQCASETGIMLTVEDTYPLSFTRLLALTGQEFGDLQSEIEADTPQGRKLAEDRELMQAVHDDTGNLKWQREAEKTLQAELDKLSPAEKMRRARELGQSLSGRLTGSGESKAMTAEEKAHHLAQLKSSPRPCVWPATVRCSDDFGSEIDWRCWISNERRYWRYCPHYSRIDGIRQ